MTDRTYSLEHDGHTVGPLTAREVDKLVCDNLLKPDHTIVRSDGTRMSAGEVCSSAVEKDDTPPPLPSPHLVEPTAWNPVVIAWLGLAFSPIWSAIMAAVNARRLGTSLPVWRPILAVVGLLLLDVAVSCLLFESVLLSFLLFLGAAWLTWRMGLRAQLPAYEVRSTSNRDGPGWLVPAIAGVPCAVVVFLVFIVSPLIPSEPGWLVANYDGVLFYEAGDLETAVSRFSEAIKLNPQFADAYNNRGLALTELGHTAQAIHDFDKAVELAPNMALAYFNRGLAQYEQGDYDRVIGDVNEAIRLAPDAPETYAMRGRAQMERGETASAIADFSEAIRLHPDYAEAYCNRGIAHLLDENIEQALADLDKAIRLDPASVVAFSHRGVARLRSGDLDGAIADLTQAIQLEPNDPIAYNMRGAAYCEKGLYSQAIADCDEALRLDPDYEDARENKQRAERAKLASGPAVPFRLPLVTMPEPQDASAWYKGALARTAPRAAWGVWQAAKHGPSDARVFGRLGKGLLVGLIAIAGALAALWRRVVQNRHVTISTTKDSDHKREKGDR